MDEVSKVFMASFLVFAFAFMGSFVGDYPSRQKIKKCELELPRNQHCELVAVPAKGEK